LSGALNHRPEKWEGKLIVSKNGGVWVPAKTGRSFQFGIWGIYLDYPFGPQFKPKKAGAKQRKAKKPFSLNLFQRKVISSFRGDFPRILTLTRRHCGKVID